MLTQMDKQMKGHRGLYQCKKRLDGYSSKSSKFKAPCITNNMANVVSTEIYQAATCLDFDLKKYLPLIGH